MAGYTYDPSESIKQGFQQATASIGGIFNQVIQQQHRDYTLAENAFQNIEALKKDLNIFGQKTVTQKSNDLLKEAGSAILQNGKLDYSKLGEIRQKVSEIKDLKQGYEVGAKEYERVLQLGIANKDNMFSFEKFYKDLAMKMGDENLVKNPQDLQRALIDTYSKNLDATTMYGKMFLKQNPLQKVTQDIRNAKGQVIGVASGEIPSNLKVGDDGKIIYPPAITITGVDGNPVKLDYIDQKLQEVQNNNPELWSLMKNQTGFGGSMLSDRAIMENYLSKIPSKLNIHETKSENQLKSEELTLKQQEFKTGHQQEEFDLEKRKALASIGASSASTRASNLSSTKAELEIDALRNQNKSGLGTFPTTFNVPVKGADGKQISQKVEAQGTDLGKPIRMTIPTIKGDKSLNVTQITYDKNGVARVAYIEPAPKSAGINIIATPELNTGESQIPAGASIKYATVDSKQLNRFLSTVKQGIDRNITENADASQKWNHVQSIFSSNIYGNVTLNGATYNLDGIANKFGLKSKEEAINFINQQLNK